MMLLVQLGGLRAPDKLNALRRSRLSAQLARHVSSGSQPDASPEAVDDAQSAPSSSRRRVPGLALQRFGRDLTEEARRGLLDPVVGREQVIARTMQILLRRTKNNPVLVGEPGVGKTALVEGIAQLLASSAAPPGLAGKRLISLDVTSVLAGSSYRGEFEERLQAVVADVAAARGNIILFVDEMHMLVGAGSAEGGLDAANILKPALARGSLRCIGATTLDEYRKHVEADPAFARRFQSVLVEEPGPWEVVAWLRGLAPRYEQHHGVVFTEGAVRAAASCARRYISERRLPDSAIDLMDEAAAHMVLRAAAQAAQAAEEGQGGAGDRTAQSPGAAAPSSARSDNDSPQGPSQGAWSSVTRGPTDLHYHEELPEQAPQHAQQQERHGDGVASGRGRDGDDIYGSADSSGEPRPGRWQELDPQAGAHPPPHRPHLALRQERRTAVSGGASSGTATACGSGHIQMTLERQRRHAEIFGFGPTQPAQPPAPGHAAVSAAPGCAAGSAQGVDEGASAAAGQGGLAVGRTGAELGDQDVGAVATERAAPKACPHCGTLVTPGPETLRLRCPSCSTRFLNIAPEKLLLGTSVLLPLQQQQQQKHHQHHHHNHQWQQHPGQPRQGWADQLQEYGQPGSGVVARGGSSRDDAHPPPEDVPYGGSEVANGTAPPAKDDDLGAVFREQGLSGDGRGDVLLVDELSVLEVVARTTGLPLESVLRDHRGAPVRHLRRALEARLVGQDDAVRAVCTAVQLHRLGLAGAGLGGGGGGDGAVTLLSYSSSRPVASFLLVGPQGCGRTTMCKALAEELFHDPAALLVLHGGEYGNRTSLSRLIGAAPGYVGFGSGGLLTEALRRRPHCVLLVQDVERAHFEVQELLLRGVQEGVIRDGQGRVASLRNAVVVFTASSSPSPFAYSSTASTAATNPHRPADSYAHTADQPADEAVAATTAASLAPEPSGPLHHRGQAAGSTGPAGGGSGGAMPGGAALGMVVPELWTSVDRVVHFAPLDERHRAEVVRRQVAAMAAQLRSAGVVGIELAPQAALWLARAAAGVAQPPALPGSLAGQPAGLSTGGGSGGMAGCADLLRRQLLEPLAELLVAASERRRVVGGFGDQGGGLGTGPHQGRQRQPVVVRVELARRQAAGVGAGRHESIGGHGQATGVVDGLELEMVEVGSGAERAAARLRKGEPDGWGTVRGEVPPPAQAAVA